MKLRNVIRTALIFTALLLIWAAGRAWISEYRMIQQGQEVSLDRDSGPHLNSALRPISRHKKR